VFISNVPFVQYVKHSRSQSGLPIIEHLGIVNYWLF
jgi:hypothetical protein